MIRVLNKQDKQNEQDNQAVQNVQKTANSGNDERIEAQENVPEKVQEKVPQKAQKRRLDTRYLIAVPVILLLCFGLGAQYAVYLTGLPINTAQAADIIAVSGFDAPFKEGDIVVVVSGETAHKGYYSMSPDTTLRELLDYCGLKKESDISEIDFSHQPEMGDMYYIKSTANPLDVEPWLTNEYAENVADSENNSENKSDNETQENNAADSETNTNINTKLININTATSEELQTLPNIGEVKAQAIIDYRVEHGGFKYKEELMGVSGIGSKTYAELVDQITL
jgi:comEA protein